MKSLYTYLRTLTLAFSLILPLISFAVTQKEMEEARTISTKAYLRWANDGSGYLDDINPKTMDELEAALKPKEKENIKAFKAIPVPSDYQTWDKQKLVEFWVAAFQDPNLLEKGRGGRIRARSLINKMTVTPPQAAGPASASIQEASVVKDTTIAQKEGQLQELRADEKAILEDEAYDEEINTENASSYTWVYIMILAILVAIVVALVVYAANVFKKNGSGGQYAQRDNGMDRERLESLVSDKDAEISMLVKKLEATTRQNGDLKAKLEGAMAELAALRTTVRTPRGETESVTRPRNEAESVTTRPKTPLRSIYLGRANARGIFVRADRSLNPGNSIFLLDTADGKSGTFRIAESPAAWDLALSNPTEYLENACTGRNLDDTEYATRIVTDTPGTAIFEDGCWRLVRKARIHYQS